MYAQEISSSVTSEIAPRSSATRLPGPGNEALDHVFRHGPSTLDAATRDAGDCPAPRVHIRAVAVPRVGNYHEVYCIFMKRTHDTPPSPGSSTAPGLSDR
jgi:hypothetical protein